MNLKREIEFAAAWDKRHSEPSKNYGVHGVELRMYIKGPHGVVQFVVFTQWMLPGHPELPESIRGPLPADLGYHSPKPMYDDQEPMSNKCRFIEGGVCYYDGSGLRADEVFKILKREGSDGVWAFLENEYKSLFLDERRDD